MSRPPSPAPKATPIVIDLTDDSDDDLVRENQVATPLEIAIKQEPNEGEEPVIVPETIIGETQVTTMEPGIEQVDPTLAEANNEPAHATATGSHDEPEDTDTNHTNIAHADLMPVHLENEQITTGSAQTEDNQPDTTLAPVMDDQTDVVATTEATEIVPDQFDQIQTSVNSEQTGIGELSQSTADQLGDVAQHIKSTNDAEEDTLFVLEDNEADNVVPTQPEIEHDDINLVGTLQDASTESLEEHNEGLPLGEEDPFNSNNVNESPEDPGFELPNFDHFSDMDIDLDGLNALQQYNQNKADLDDDDIVYDLPDGAEPFVEDLAENGYRMTQASPEPLGTVVDDNGDVIDWSALMEEDAAAAHELRAAAFAKRKKEYERKKEMEINTQEDDIRFAAEKGEEQRRLRDLARSQMEVEEPPERTDMLQGLEEDDLLFVPEYAEAQPKKKASPKQKNRLSKKDVDDAISAGIQAGFGTSRPPKRKAPVASEDRQPKKRRGAGKTGGTKKAAPKRGRKQGPNMSNIASLGQTNIVAAAQANADQPDMPTFTSKNKEKALKELIASLPSAERSGAGSDRAAILEATKKFKGRGAMKADAHGGWILKGMESSLYNHQLLGAAFLRERETGDSKPKGGMVCDEMGFGKTIQMM